MLLLIFKLKTPHPNPLPASGEKGRRRRFFSKNNLKKLSTIFRVGIKKSI